MLYSSSVYVSLNVDCCGDLFIGCFFRVTEMLCCAFDFQVLLLVERLCGCCSCSDFVCLRWWVC